MVHAIGGAAGLRLQLCGFQYTENASRGRGGFVTSETHGNVHGVLTLRFSMRSMRARSAGRHERRTIAVRPDLREQGEHRSRLRFYYNFIIARADSAFDWIP